MAGFCGLARLASAGAIVLAGVNGAAVSKSRTVNAVQNVICFHSDYHGWNQSAQRDVEQSIEDFCGTKKYGKASSLPELSSYIEDYHIPGGVIRVSVHNAHCSAGWYIDQDICKTALSGIVDNCWIGAGGQVDVGGGNTDPCGDWFVDMNPPVIREALAKSHIIPASSTVLESSVASTATTTMESRTGSRQCSSATSSAVLDTRDGLDIECFTKSNSWESDVAQKISDAIGEFCSEFVIPANLEQDNAYSSWYNVSGANVISMTVGNRLCPAGQVVTQTTCWTNLLGIFNGCKQADGSNTGGTSSDACGNWILQHNPNVLFTPPVGKRCAQTCYQSATSGCNPPNWDSCSASEKSCLLASASDFEACLKAGNCTPDC